MSHLSGLMAICLFLFSIPFGIAGVVLMGVSSAFNAASEALFWVADLFLPWE